MTYESGLSGAAATNFNFGLLGGTFSGIWEQSMLQDDPMNTLRDSIAPHQNQVVRLLHWSCYPEEQERLDNSHVVTAVLITTVLRLLLALDIRRLFGEATRPCFLMLMVTKILTG